MELHMRRVYVVMLAMVMMALTMMTMICQGHGFYPWDDNISSLPDAAVGLTSNTAVSIPSSSLSCMVTMCAAVGESSNATVSITGLLEDTESVVLNELDADLGFLFNDSTWSSTQLDHFAQFGHEVKYVKIDPQSSYSNAQFVLDDMNDMYESLYECVQRYINGRRGLKLYFSI